MLKPNVEFGYMRITQLQIDEIKKCFSKSFGAGELYLFGSRLDDSKRGGDIDLYIIPNNEIDLYKKKIAFLVELEKRIGEQKVDVVLARKDIVRDIDKTVLKEGVRIC